MQAKRVVPVLCATLALAVVFAGSTGLLAARAPQNATAAAPKCHITPVEAIRLAQGRVPGRALNANFEFDEGRWVYGVMIVAGTTIKEVTVDPMTGKVGTVETVTPTDEAKEIRDDLTAAVNGKSTTQGGSHQTVKKPIKAKRP